MNRREALRRVAFLMGGALSAGTPQRRTLQLPSLAGRSHRSFH